MIYRKTVAAVMESVDAATNGRIEMKWFQFLSCAQMLECQSEKRKQVIEFNLDMKNISRNEFLSNGFKGSLLQRIDYPNVTSQFICNFKLSFQMFYRL